uniref:Uncharacterized protein n=1 Tax=Pristionchus pacificus TaxID=54126 RepID=A0A8R1YTB8_PRIPA
MHRTENISNYKNLKLPSLPNKHRAKCARVRRGMRTEEGLERVVVFGRIIRKKSQSHILLLTLFRSIVHLYFFCHVPIQKLNDLHGKQAKKNVRSLAFIPHSLARPLSGAVLSLHASPIALVAALPITMPQPYDGMDIREYAWMKDLKEICTAKGSFTINHKTGRLEKKEGPNVFEANEPEDPSY